MLIVTTSRKCFGQVVLVSVSIYYALSYYGGKGVAFWPEEPVIIFPT